MKHHFLLWALIPLCTVLYQYFIKDAALGLEGIPFGSIWLKTAFTNPAMLMAIASDLVAFFAWMKILADHDLSRAFPLTSVSYLLVLALGWFVFKEPVTMLEVIGCVLILAGVWLIGTATPTEN